MNNMAFTDEDLKRLKRCLPPQDIAGGLTISYREWKALLARLEAAERLTHAAIESGVGKPLWEDYFKAAGGGRE
jgi:hypothetical protein